MNIWTFTGNLGKDAVLKSTQGGTTVCQFSVAVSSGYGDNKKTTWVMCAIFGKRAEGSLPQYLVKGTQVAISGEAFLDEWQNDNGTQKLMKVRVDNVDLIGGKKSSSQQGGYQQQQQPQQAPPGTDLDPFDFDIPF